MDTNLGVPFCETMEADGLKAGELKARDLIQDMNLEKLDCCRYLWDDRLQRWFEDARKCYYHPNTPKEFFLLKNGAHEHRFPSTPMQEIMLYIPKRIVITVLDRDQVNFSEELLSDPNYVFYKFKYNAPGGRVYPFTALCRMSDEELTPESRTDLIDEVLRPGAKWFCEHLSEEYRQFFKTDGWAQVFKASHPEEE